MTLSRKQIISVLLLLALVFSLPVAVYLTRKMQDVRPRALQGKANFLLSTDSITSTVGKNIDVLVTLQTTDPSLKVSGVDFLLLYDKNRLDVGNIVPNVIAVDPKAPFTDSLIVTSGGSFDENINFLRVSQIARRPTDQLPTGTFQLAKITFRGRGVGSATIKFPDDNKYLEIVGIGIDISPTPIPTNVPTNTPVPVTITGNPPITPTPTGVVSTPTPTPTGVVSTPTPTPTGVVSTPTPIPMPNGQSCTTASQCASGFCANGVCCNTACTGPHDQCNSSGSCTTPTKTFCYSGDVLPHSCGSRCAMAGGWCTRPAVFQDLACKSLRTDGNNNSCDNAPYPQIKGSCLCWNYTVNPSTSFPPYE